jgi:hypothetical protein
MRREQGGRFTLFFVEHHFENFLSLPSNHGPMQDALHSERSCAVVASSCDWLSSATLPRPLQRTWSGQPNRSSEIYWTGREAAGHHGAPRQGLIKATPKKLWLKLNKLPVPSAPRGTRDLSAKKSGIPQGALCPLDICFQCLRPNVRVALFLQLHQANHTRRHDLGLAQ